MAQPLFVPLVLPGHVIVHHLLRLAGLVLVLVLLRLRLRQCVLRLPAAAAWGGYPGGLPVIKGDGLFPRIKA